MVEELQTIKAHQVMISSSLKEMQRDNQLLWAEMIASRQRHQRQQQTTFKILQFLASVFRNEKGNLRASQSRLLLPNDSYETLYVLFSDTNTNTNSNTN